MEEGRHGQPKSKAAASVREEPLKVAAVPGSLVLGNARSTGAACWVVQTRDCSCMCCGWRKSHRLLLQIIGLSNERKKSRRYKKRVSWTGRTGKRLGRALRAFPSLICRLLLPSSISPSMLPAC